MIRMKATTTRRTPSSFAAADRLSYPNATQLRAWPRMPAPTSNPRSRCSATPPTVDARNDALTSRYPSPGRAKRPAAK
jgi:hypothetical protein